MQIAILEMELKMVDDRAVAMILLLATTQMNNIYSYNASHVQCTTHSNARNRYEHFEMAYNADFIMEFIFI